ncbi:MAG: hypothetical protein U0168_26140 [Nannocystaceae bacterium]
MPIVAEPIVIEPCEALMPPLPESALSLIVPESESLPEPLPLLPSLLPFEVCVSDPPPHAEPKESATKMDSR